MPYVKRDFYLKWLSYIRYELYRINAARLCDLTGEPEYYIGFRYASHKICLIKEDCVYARGMKQIEYCVYELKRRYKIA